MPKTLFDKIWDAHVVTQEPQFPAVYCIDAHLIHEVTSPQAFTRFRNRGIPVFRTDRTWAIADHKVPTKAQNLAIKDMLSKLQVEKFTQN